MDGITLNASLRECSALLGGKIDKIQQPEQDMLLFTVRNNGANFKLLLSSNAESGRIQLTEDTFPNPTDAPLFCMLLRKRLQGGRIERIEQAGVDRVVTFFIASRDEFGDSTQNTLVVEIMGKYSNITLVDCGGTVVDCIKRVGPQMSSVRTLLPGVHFQYMPPQEKKNPFDLSINEYRNMYIASKDSFDKLLLKEVSGMSKELSGVFTNMTVNPPDFLFAAMCDLQNNCLHPCVVLYEDGEPKHYLPFVPDNPCGAVKSFSTLYQAADFYYRERNVKERIRRHGKDLRVAVSNAITKAERKLALHTDAMLAGEHCEEDKLYGELITANIYQIHKGQRCLKAANYYDPHMQEIVIPLDPLLSPSENAQKYYRRYRKVLRAADFAKEQIGILSSELAWLNSELTFLETCETPNELDEIKNELISEGYIKIKPSHQKKAKTPASKPMRFVSSDGISILVGKNNLQNDRITFTALPDAVWLHVKDAPGSHVIVQSHGIPPDATLQEAAMLAVWNSSRRNGVSVPVDYTLKKNVKKPSGARAGFVIFSTNKTLYVTPDKATLKSINREE